MKIIFSGAADTGRKLMWYVYILKCSDGALYTGITTDVSRRLDEHNHKKGGACTRARIPVRLVHKEKCGTRSEALKREHQIKTWSRRKKLAFIAGGRQKGRDPMESTWS
jgi:putative endonuclease